jgi:hypothetical protein
MSDDNAAITDRVARRRHQSRARVAEIERHHRELRERDTHICTCAHRCATHGSYLAGEFVGIGYGPCGWPDCDCDHFTDSGATSTHALNLASPRQRDHPVAHRTCPDCQAAPGEACHWACSSWWS